MATISQQKRIEQRQPFEVLTNAVHSRHWQLQDHPDSSQTQPLQQCLHVSTRRISIRAWPLSSCRSDIRGILRVVSPQRRMTKMYCAVLVLVVVSMLLLCKTLLKERPIDTALVWIVPSSFYSPLSSKSSTAPSTRTTTTGNSASIAVDSRAIAPSSPTGRHPRRPLVIGAGQGSTATRTMYHALCQLGIPSVHFRQNCVSSVRATTVDSPHDGGREAFLQEELDHSLSKLPAKRRRRRLDLAEETNLENRSVLRSRTQTMHRITRGQRNQWTGNQTVVSRAAGSSNHRSGLEAHYELVRAFRDMKNCENGRVASNGKKRFRQETKQQQQRPRSKVGQRTNQTTLSSSSCRLVTDEWMQSMYRLLDQVIASDDIDGVLDTPYPYFLSYLVPAAQRIRGVAPVIVLTERPEHDWALKRSREFPDQVLCQPTWTMTPSAFLPRNNQSLRLTLKNATSTITAVQNESEKEEEKTWEASSFSETTRHTVDPNTPSDRTNNSTSKLKTSEVVLLRWAQGLDIPTCFESVKKKNKPTISATTITRDYIQDGFAWQDLFVPLYKLVDSSVGPNHGDKNVVRNPTRNEQEHLAQVAVLEGNFSTDNMTSSLTQPLVHRPIPTQAKLASSSDLLLDNRTDPLWYVAQALRQHHALIRPLAQYHVNLFTRQPRLTTLDLAVELQHAIPELCSEPQWIQNRLEKRHRRAPKEPAAQRQGESSSLLSSCPQHT